MVEVGAQVMTRDESKGGWVPLGRGGVSRVCLIKRLSNHNNNGAAAEAAAAAGNGADVVSSDVGGGDDGGAGDVTFAAAVVSSASSAAEYRIHGFLDHSVSTRYTDSWIIQ